MITATADVSISKVDGSPVVVGLIQTCRLISVSEDKLELVIAQESTGTNAPKYEMKIAELQRALDTIKAALPE